MARWLDEALVIDVESTCWENGPPKNQMSEIIEIGLCTVDLKNLRRLEKRSILVRPLRSDVSPFCTDLTTITPDMVATAEPLPSALEILKHDYGSRERLFASWGDYDRNQFHRNCEAYGLAYPFGPTHLNVKTLFSAALGLPRELGLDAALEHVGLTLEGTHHRGDDDAWNIAELFCWLLRRTRGTGVSS